MTTLILLVTAFNSTRDGTTRGTGEITRTHPITESYKATPEAEKDQRKHMMQKYAYGTLEEEEDNKQDDGTQKNTKHGGRSSGKFHPPGEAVSLLMVNRNAENIKQQEQERREQMKKQSEQEKERNKKQQEKQKADREKDKEKKRTQKKENSGCNLFTAFTS